MIKSILPNTLLYLITLFPIGLLAQPPLDVKLYEKGYKHYSAPRSAYSDYFGGSSYEGKTGYYSETYLDGSKYEGNLLNGRPHGEGKGIFPDGDIYIGDWKNGSRTGYGEYIYKDGTGYEQDRYIGYWKNNEKHGKGTYTWKSGSKYIGQYYNDKMYGEGIFHYPSGGRLEGYFTNNFTLRGKFHYADGSVYEGNIVDELRDGYGKLYNIDGSLRYEGQWKNGERHGKGTFYWKSGDRYDGSWYKNTKKGKGSYYWKNGSKYVGDFVNDDFNGFGTEFNIDGTKDYEGYWKNDKRHGEGIIYNFYECSKGRHFIGIHSFGKKEGEWRQFDCKGKIESITTFKEDIFNGKTVGYNVDGSTSYEAYYVNGESHGKTIFYHDNGEFESIHNYSYGIHIDRSFYYENGQLSHVDKNDGDGNFLTMDFYLPNGQKTMTNGNGVFTVFRQNKTISREITYKNGIENGITKYFHLNGKVACLELISANEKLNGKIDCYLNDGTKSMVNGKGNCITYYINGSVKSKEEYSSRKKDGVSTYYYENGQIEEIIEYKYDPVSHNELLLNVVQSLDKEGNQRDVGSIKNGNGIQIKYFYYRDGSMGSYTREYVDGVKVEQ